MSLFINGSCNIPKIKNNVISLKPQPSKKSPCTSHVASNLPDELCELISSFLTQHQAIRMRHLNRQWDRAILASLSHRGITVSNLDFSRLSQRRKLVSLKLFFCNENLRVKVLRFKCIDGLPITALVTILSRQKSLEVCELPMATITKPDFDLLFNLRATSVELAHICTRFNEAVGRILHPDATSSIFDCIICTKPVQDNTVYMHSSELLEARGKDLLLKAFHQSVNHHGDDDTGSSSKDNTLIRNVKLMSSTFFGLGKKDKGGDDGNDGHGGDDALDVGEEEVEKKPSTTSAADVADVAVGDVEEKEATVIDSERTLVTTTAVEDCRKEEVKSTEEKREENKDEMGTTTSTTSSNDKQEEQQQHQCISLLGYLNLKLAELNEKCLNLMFNCTSFSVATPFLPSTDKTSELITIAGRVSRRYMAINEAKTLLEEIPVKMANIRLLHRQWERIHKGLCSERRKEAASSSTTSTAKTYWDTWKLSKVTLTMVDDVLKVLPLLKDLQTKPGVLETVELIGLLEENPENKKSTSTEKDASKGDSRTTTKERKATSSRTEDDITIGMILRSKLVASDLMDEKGGLESIAGSVGDFFSLD